jgi:hypothetical protein
MKQKLLIAAAWALAALPIYAQDAGGNFAAPGTNRDIREVRPRSPDEVLRPKTHGVIVMISEHGLQVINPAAPASLGRGETVLSQNIATDGRIADEKPSHKPFGGIQLFGWLF